MAKIIEFYIPTSLQKRLTTRQAREKGKLIEFCAISRKPA
jgi:hypothetical protein